MYIFDKIAVMCRSTDPFSGGARSVRGDRGSTPGCFYAWDDLSMG